MVHVSSKAWKTFCISGSSVLEIMEHNSLGFSGPTTGASLSMVKTI